MKAAQQKNAIFISFDALAVSGITVEAVKIARLLQSHGYRCYMDLGYDIKIDKGNFGKPYNDEFLMYQDVFTLTRIDDIISLPDYNPEYIDHVHNVLISQKTQLDEEQHNHLVANVESLAEHISDCIVAQWERLCIRNVIIENGTLPENIIYTKALYLSIEKYGQRHDLKKFVVWRDHDLMWNSEKTIKKYGSPPYHFAVKPKKSPYINYVTLNSHLKKMLEEWCDNNIEVLVKKNTYDFSEPRPRYNIRNLLGISDEDILFARTTRIIPQKRIDRDINIIYHLNNLFKENNSNRRVYLAIAGSPDECPDYTSELEKLTQSLGSESYVKFIGILPHEFFESDINKISIDDLYYSCDVVSFLTSYDYDSYGNPIGEAISHKRCYITTSYEYYQEVYGKHGFEAPVLMISEFNDGLATSEFINELFEFLNDGDRMKLNANNNFEKGKQILSHSILEIMNID
ncbi:glycosyltransferase [uncultured Enterobacter sp.]|uniref:glycosyltransferase n=1 Tax=uncultured Enterobacter sp. TaxID=238202 RepID=UPI0026007E42|nr:glycosyltransferase [uncultured Enterobacter sp.]